MFSTCMISGAEYGTGQLKENLTDEAIIIARRVCQRSFRITSHSVSNFSQYWWLCEVAYCWASVGCKVSVCIFLLRITVIRIHRWILYCISMVTIVCGIIFMMLMLLQCHPISYFWDKVNQDGYCIDMKIIVIMTYIYSVAAATCDFTVGLLPIFLVKNLNMNKKAKIAVAGILGMACVYVSYMTRSELSADISSASSAVIIRFPYVETFYDPEFLCML